MSLQLSCLSSVNPYITFSETFFSKTPIFLPYLYAFLSFFSSIMQNFSFGCITHFHSNKQGLSHNSDCSTKQYKPHQCCNAVSHPMVLDKASPEKIPSGWAGKSCLATMLLDWHYGPTQRIIEIEHTNSEMKQALATYFINFCIGFFSYMTFPYLSSKFETDA